MSRRHVAPHHEPIGSNMARKSNKMHPGRVLREEYMEPLSLDATGLAAALGVTAGRLEPIIADREPVYFRLRRCNKVKVAGSNPATSNAFSATVRRGRPRI